MSNIPRAFAVQSMVGELAHATNRDQKDMLLQLIGSPRIVKLDSVKDLWNYGEPYDSYPIDTGRLRRVVELVADKGGWGRSVPKGHGLGIAGLTGGSRRELPSGRRSGARDRRGVRVRQDDDGTVAGAPAAEQR